MGVGGDSVWFEIQIWFCCIDYSTGRQREVRKNRQNRREREREQACRRVQLYPTFTYTTINQVDEGGEASTKLIDLLSLRLPLLLHQLPQQDV